MATFVATGMVWWVVSVGIAHAVGVDAGERAREVINHIPPPVIVAGEPIHDATLFERMRELHVPGVSIAVIRHGRLDWARGFGVTREGGQAVNVESLFLASSISKPITALAVLRLAEQGRIDLDAPANAYLRSWKIPDDDLTRGHPVTVRELLTHTAGVNNDGFGGYPPGAPLPTLNQILDGAAPADNPPIRVDTTPGSVTRYSGGGYVILRRLLEDVTSEPFGKLMRDLVFDPVGMSHSSFDQPLTQAELRHAAWPHDRTGRALSGGPRVYPELAPDGMWTTPSDLVRYIQAVDAALDGQQGALVSRATARSMVRAVRGHFGLAAVAGDEPATPWFAFNGGSYGVPSLFVAYENGDGLVVMTNGQNGFELGVSLTRSVARAYRWPGFQPRVWQLATLPPHDAARDAGAYELAPGSDLVVGRRGPGLTLQTTWAGRQPLYPSKTGAFFWRNPWLEFMFNRSSGETIRFDIDSQGAVTGLDLLAPSGKIAAHARRLDAAPALAVTAEMDDADRRFAAQTPAAGATDALAKVVTSLAASAPDYDRMTPDIAAAVRNVREADRQIFVSLGELKSVAFARTSPTGVDTYRMVFENGEGEMDIAFQHDGLIRTLQWYPS